MAQLSLVQFSDNSSLYFKQLGASSVASAPIFMAKDIVDATGGPTQIAKTITSGATEVTGTFLIPTSDKLHFILAPQDNIPESGDPYTIVFEDKSVMKGVGIYIPDNQANSTVLYFFSCNFPESVSGLALALKEAGETLSTPYFAIIPANVISAVSV